MVCHRFILTLSALSLLTACAGNEAGTVTAPVTAPATSPAASDVKNTAPLPDVSALVRKIATQGGCKDSTAEVRLTAETEGGKKEQVEFRLQRRYAADKVLTLLSVTSPREETEKALLATEPAAQPTEAISYLAGLKKTARFKSNSARDFRGARIFVQELLGMEMSRYAVGPAQRVQENNQSLLKSTLEAKPDFNLAFPRIDAFFQESDQQPVRFDLFDDQKKMARRVKVLETKSIQNYQTITRVEIEDLLANRRVNMETLRVTYDRNLPESLFTEASLQKLITDASRRLIQ